MADTKVSGLAAAASFLSTHEIPVNEAGTSKKVTGAQIMAAVALGMPSGGYSQITANVTPITAQADVGLTVTCTFVAGRRIMVTGYATSFGSTVATDSGQFYIMEGVSQLQVLATGTVGSVANPGAIVTVVLQPSAGTHTYKLQVARIGTGNLTMFASATQPAYILVEDIGGF